MGDVNSKVEAISEKATKAIPWLCLIYGLYSVVQITEVIIRKCTVKSRLDFLERLNPFGRLTIKARPPTVIFFLIKSNNHCTRSLAISKVKRNMICISLKKLRTRSVPLLSAH